MEASPAKAFELYTRACDAKSAAGCAGLASEYARGVGTSRDDARATELFVKSCESGFFDACVPAGERVAYGVGAARDVPRAMVLWTSACEHSVADVLRREVLGLGEVLGNVLIGHGYAEYVAVYLAFALLAVSAHRAPLAALRRMSLQSETTFTAAYALLYTLLFGFYAPIAAGNRFILMLFLPVLYTLMRTAPRRPGTVSVFGRALTRDDLNAFVLASIVLWILFGLPGAITRIYAGG